VALVVCLVMQPTALLAQTEEAGSFDANRQGLALDDSPEQVLNSLMSQGRDLPDAAVLAVSEAEGFDQRRAIVRAAQCLAETEDELGVLSQSLLGYINDAGDDAELREEINSFGYGSCEGQESESLVKPPETLTDDGSGPGTNVISPSS
jgi:hypothetical protein